VLTRVAEPGRVAGAGATVLTLVDLGRLYLRAFVPEGRIGLVKLEQRAEVFLDSAPDTPIEAEVMRIDPQAMFTPENTYFREERVKQVVGVKLRLKAGQGSAKPGMPADARILTRGSAGLSRSPGRPRPAGSLKDALAADGEARRPAGVTPGPRASGQQEVAG
jgi:HlyD family secretion protein